VSRGREQARLLASGGEEPGTPAHERVLEIIGARVRSRAATGGGRATSAQAMSTVGRSGLLRECASLCHQSPLLRAFGLVSCWPRSRYERRALAAPPLR